MSISISTSVTLSLHKKHMQRDSEFKNWFNYAHFHCLWEVQPNISCAVSHFIFYIPRKLPLLCKGIFGEGNRSGTPNILYKHYSVTFYSVCKCKCGYTRYSKYVVELLWVLNVALWLPAGVTLGAMGAPHNALAAVWLLLGLAPLALWEPDRRIPFTP